MILRDDLEMREFNFLDERASKSKDSLGRDVTEIELSIQKHFVG